MKDPAQRLNNLQKIGYLFKEGLSESSRKRWQLRYNNQADESVQEVVESAGEDFLPKSTHQGRWRKFYVHLEAPKVLF